MVYGRGRSGSAGGIPAAITRNGPRRGYVRLYAFGVSVVALFTLLHVAMFHEASNPSVLRPQQQQQQQQQREQLEEQQRERRREQLREKHEHEDELEQRQPAAVERENSATRIVYDKAQPDEGKDDRLQRMDARGEVDELFEPGSLDLTRTEAVSKCYVDASKYPRKSNMCTYSNKYKVLYYMIPKSGSSTGRHVMKDKNAFEAEEMPHHKCMEMWSQLDVLKTVSVRNPLSRFYASYDEAFVRRLANQASIPKQYFRYMEPFIGWDYEKYSALFDTTEGVRKLTDSFEAFVEDFDGRIIFDVHLALQMPMLWDRDRSKIIDLDLAFDTHDLDNALTALADRVGAPRPHVIRGRSYPRRFDTKALKDSTLQKICRLAALDFCCINYELPEPCRRHLPPGERVKCRWREGKDGVRQIEPVIV